MTPAAPNYAGLVLGVLSILVTIYVAIRYAERKDPRLHYVTTPRISGGHDPTGNIAISFRGAPVDRVTSTMVWVWNAGKRPIHGSDVPAADPLILTLRDGEELPQILDCVLRKASRSAVNFAATPSTRNAIEFQFAFLDRLDGAVFEIQHTGSESTQVAINGTVLGAPKGFRVTGPTPIPRQTSLTKRIGISIVTTLVLGGGTALLYRTANDVTTDPKLLQRTLTPFVSPDSLHVAITNIVATSKYGGIIFNRYGAYVVSALLVLLIVVLLLGIWSRGYPFPPALLPDHGSTGLAEGPVPSGPAA